MGNMLVVHKAVWVLLLAHPAAALALLAAT